MHNIEINMSLGGISGTRDYPGALESALNHGLSGTRIFDLFMNTWDKDVIKIVDRIQYLMKPNTVKTNKILLCLSDLPFSWLSDYTVQEINALSQMQKDILTYCNRMPIKAHRIQEYKDLINSLIQELTKRNLLQYCSFELNCEHDAARYFFGTFEQFKEMNLMKYDCLKNTNRPIFIGDFTSSLIRDPSYKNKQAFMDYINNDPIFNNVGFSFSNYRTDSGGVFDFNNNSYPTRTFAKGAIMTECNMYTSFDKSGSREAVFNSIEYVKWFWQVLDFVKRKNIKEIYIHPWVETPNGQDGKMGVWKKNTEGASYTPKKAWYMIMDIIKTMNSTTDAKSPLMYDLAPNKIIGKLKTLTITPQGTYTVTTNA